MRQVPRQCLEGLAEGAGKELAQGAGANSWRKEPVEQLARSWRPRGLGPWASAPGLPPRTHSLTVISGGDSEADELRDFARRFLRAGIR